MFKLVRAAICVVMLAGLSAGAASAQEWPAQRWQCAPFARLASGIQIFGDARTWWNQADGRYERGNAPEVGAVLAFKATGRMRYGHVAMVSEIIDGRTIKVTHANWSPINGARGQVEENVEVVDVSENNDWSEVRVWYAPLADLGTSSHPTYGFIYADDAALQLAAATQTRATTPVIRAVATLDDAIGELIVATDNVVGE
jgi:surface antigen